VLLSFGGHRYTFIAPNTEQIGRSLVKLLVVRKPGSDDLPLPAYATRGSAGVDLCASVVGPVAIEPGKRALIDCGICVAIPEGYEGQVRPRSGFALSHGVTVLNSPGTVDSDYRGEIRVILINLGDEVFLVERGLRIAQLIISPIARVELQPVEVLPSSERNDGGFGHTGGSFRSDPDAG
jgi:dUTP pyrophosphatase